MTSPNVIPLHRGVIVPPLDYDRSPEPDTPIVFTGAEVWFAFFLGGVFVVVVEVVAAFVWSFL